MNSDEKKYKPDLLYFSDKEGYLFYYSITENKILYNLGQPMLGLISAMAISQDNKFLYVADNYGYIKKIIIEDHRVIKDFGKVHDTVIKSIDVTPAGDFLYSSDYKGILKCLETKNGKIIKDFNVIHPGYIQILKISGNIKGKMWTGTELKNEFKDETDFKLLSTFAEHKKIDIEIYNNSEKTLKRKKINISGEVVNDNLEDDDNKKNIIKPGEQKHVIANTPLDNAWLFVDLDIECNIHCKTREGAVLAFRPFKTLVENTKVKIYISEDLHPCHGDNYQFTSDCFGHLKQWNVCDNTLAKDYGQVHMGSIICMKVTNDCEHIFTAGEDKVLKQFSIHKKELVKNYGEVHRYPICAMESSVKSWTNSVGYDEFLFTCDNYGYVKQWDIKQYQKLYKNLGKLNDVGINYIWNDNNRNLIVFSGVLGKIKAFGTESGRIEEDNRIISEDGICCLCNLEEHHF